MIEFCTKKRMAAAIIVLIGVSVVVLVFENNYSIDHGIKDVTHPPGSNITTACWEEYHHEVVEECAPCTIFEMKMLAICKKTGYRELVRCSLPSHGEQTVKKSCPKLSWLEERNFWIFESCAAIIGLGAYTMVQIRQKRLDKLLIDKVHAQIAAGV